MTNFKKLHLSVITQVINEKGEELIERATSKKTKNIGGLTREWFIEQDLEPPKELDDDVELDEDGAVILDEEHLNYDSLSVTLPLENIDSWVEDSEIGSTVYMKSGIFYHVYETVEELDDYVSFLTLGKLESLWIDIKLFFRRIKRQNQIKPENIAQKEDEN